MKNLQKHNAEHGITKVIFRVWRKKPNDVIALFPEVPADCNGFYCVSYEHIGQHGSVDYNHVVSKTKLAAPNQYFDLMAELENLGYCLEVKCRMTRQDYLNRQDMLKRI